MPKMRKTSGLCDCVGKGSNTVSAAYSRRQNSCYLHGMFPEEKVVNGSNWLRKADRRTSYLFLVSFLILSFSASFASSARAGANMTVSLTLRAIRLMPVRSVGFLTTTSNCTGLSA